MAGSHTGAKGKTRRGFKMIKDNQKYFNRLHVVLDAVVVAASYMLAWYLKFASPFSDIDASVGVLSMRTYFQMLYVIVPGYIVLYYYFNLYTPKRATEIGRASCRERV